MSDLTFHPGFDGEVMGIAQRLAFAGEPVYVGALSRIHGVGICGAKVPEIKDCVIPEEWECPLSDELADGDGLAQRVGMILGVAEPDSRRVGTLVWYKDGIPLPPPFIVFGDERHLAGDWGERAVPSAMAIPVSSPAGKAYRLGHGRLAPLLGAARWTGPLLIWHRLNSDGPVFDGFSTRLGGPAVHACLALLSVELPLFLRSIYGSTSVTPPFFREDAVAATVRVTVPPWPRILDDGEVTSEVEMPAADWIWPLDLRRDKDGILWTACRSLVVADVVAVNADPRRAASAALSRAKAIRVDNAQVRSDSLRFAPHFVKKLDKRGYLK